mmetsp:Transcript_10416/g.23585  ORF Transcript_10416/g.23585 Transcript_10416/m.23585 type:complete len:538 (+) Transcript_10416:134-1747(+)
MAARLLALAALATLQHGATAAAVQQGGGTMIRAEITPQGAVSAVTPCEADYAGQWQVDPHRHLGALRIKGRTRCLHGVAYGEQGSTVGMAIGCATTQQQYYLHYSANLSQIQFCTPDTRHQCTWAQCLQVGDMGTLSQQPCSDGLGAQQWEVVQVKGEEKYVQVKVRGHHWLQGKCLKAHIPSPHLLQVRECVGNAAVEHPWEPLWRWPWSPDMALPWHAGPKCRESQELYGAIKMRGPLRCLAGPAGVTRGDGPLAMMVGCSPYENRFLFQWKEDHGLLQVCNQDAGHTCRWDHCVEVGGWHSGSPISVKPCSPLSHSQHWLLKCWGGYKDIVPRWAPTLCLKVNAQDYSTALHPCRETHLSHIWDAAWTLPFMVGDYRPKWCADTAAFKGAWKIKGAMRCMEFSCLDCSGQLGQNCSVFDMKHLFRFEGGQAKLCNPDSCGDCQYNACLEPMGLTSGSAVMARTCRASNPMQRWVLKAEGGYWEVRPQKKDSKLSVKSMCLMAKPTHSSSPLSIERCTSLSSGLEKLWHVPFAGS